MSFSNIPSNIQQDVLEKSLHLDSRLDLSSLPYDEQLNQIAGSSIQYIHESIGRQKEGLASLLGGHLSLLHQHALKRNLDESLISLELILLKDQSLDHIPESEIQKFISQAASEIKTSLGLPDMLPALPSSRNPQDSILAKQGLRSAPPPTSSTPSLGSHSVSSGAPPNDPMNNFSNFFKQFFHHQSPSPPPMQKYNVLWLQLSDQFLAASKKGDWNTAMLIYQELSSAVNQKQGVTNPQSSSEEGTGDPEPNFPTQGL